MAQWYSALLETEGLWAQGGTLIFSYICRLGPFLGVQNLEFQLFIYYLFFYFFIFLFFFFLGGGGGSDIWMFLRYEDFWIFLGRHHKNGLVLGVIFMHFMVNVQNVDIFGVAKISNIFFFGYAWYSRFFLKTVDSGSKATYEEKWEFASPLGLLVRASPEALCCTLEQDKLSSA